MIKETLVIIFVVLLTISLTFTLILVFENLEFNAQRTDCLNTMLFVSETSEENNVVWRGGKTFSFEEYGCYIKVRVGDDFLWVRSKNEILFEAPK